MRQPLDGPGRLWQPAWAGTQKGPFSCRATHDDVDVDDERCPIHLEIHIFHI